MTRKLITIVGARPQFVKAAAVSRALVDCPGTIEKIVHTGQHFDDNMSAVFFQELSIPAPAYNLDIHGGGHGRMTGRMLEALERIIEDEKPDAVLVYGDTNSTLAGALAAAKLHVPVAHVEAGLRSFNRRMPEELNRIITDHISGHLFCPTHEAVTNLASEGITAGVHHVGDVMYDATLFAKTAAASRSAPLLQRLGLTPDTYSLCTMHRAENTDDPDRLARIVEYLEKAAETGPVVFPIHPRTKQVLDRLAIKPKGLMLIDPVGYFEMHELLAGARQVLTDSGGLQKEAYFHRVPCITLRDETEWVETIAAGWNRLWLQDSYTERQDIAEYGDGRAAKKIVGILSDAFN